MFLAVDEYLTRLDWQPAMSALGTFRRFSLQARRVCCTSVISHFYVRMLGSRLSKIGQQPAIRLAFALEPLAALDKSFNPCVGSSPASCGSF